MVSGIIIMLLVSYIDYNFILRFSWLIYLGAIGLLGLVIVAGEQSKGAQRWFKDRRISVPAVRTGQDSDDPFSGLLFYAARGKNKFPAGAVRIFVLIGIPLALILAQPNLSTTIVLALVFCGDAVCRWAQL